jgi:lipopolysaccharide export system protein LptC
MLDRLTGWLKGGSPGRMAALVATLMATVFLLWQSDEPPLPGTGAEALRGPSEPDSFVVQARYRAWNTDGELEILLTSPRIEQFDEQGLSTLETPKARVYSARDPHPWLIEADDGTLRQGEGLAHLDGNVVVVRQLDQGESRLTTDTLTLDNQDGTVYTDDPVTIKEPFGTTTAVGMKAWVDERILELKSRVEGRYETVR